MSKIEYICLRDRKAWDNNDVEYPITHMFDEDGNYTDNMKTAVSFVCGRDKSWFVDIVDNFTDIITQ